jgi:hypothetical protein
MELEKVLLKKEELPIEVNENLYSPYFTVPIHPRLLDPNISMDKNLAREVFLRAAKEWYDDLRQYAKKIKNKENKNWIEHLFLGKKLSIKEEHGSQVVYPVRWEDTVFTSENGFAAHLSISRNAGGSLFFSKNESVQGIGFRIVRFLPEKFLEYRCRISERDGDGSRGVAAYVYCQHNIAHYPGALFLRNWAILYLNEALKQVFEK